MEKNERIIAITLILPGLEAFLREVLADETLSAEAERQRLGFVRDLEALTKPPGLPPRPANLKSQSRVSVDSIESAEDEKDFASKQRKLSNIFYPRRDIDELKDHFTNETPEEGSNKNTLKKTPVKSVKKKSIGKGIYEPLPLTAEIEEDLECGVLSEEEGLRANRSLARGTHFRASLSKAKWFAKKEKSMPTNDVYVSDLQLPTISGHLIEVRTNKRRWCVLKDQHLYIFKTQEEPAQFVIALPGCDISTVPRADKSKVSYSFKITQDGVAEVILGIEEEKDLSAWMNALITASVAKSPLSPQQKQGKGVHASWDKDDGGSLDGQLEGRRHTFSCSEYRSQDGLEDGGVGDGGVGMYEQPADVMGSSASLLTENYNPPLPPLPGELEEEEEEEEELSVTREQCGRPKSKYYSGIYEEVTEEFLETIENTSEKSDTTDLSLHSSDINGNETSPGKFGEISTTSSIPNDHTTYSEGATSDSEYSSDEDEQSSEVKGENSRLFHDRWAVHSGVLQQKRPGGWNRRYCKIVDNCLKGFRNPNDMIPVLELNLSACNVRTAEAEGKRRFIFQLNTAESESIYFNTDTKESLERWIEVISVAATSREECSAAFSEDEIDKVVEEEEASDDAHDVSRDRIPSPVPERVESLRRSRVIVGEDGVAGDKDDDAKKEVKSETPHVEVEHKTPLEKQPEHLTGHEISEESVKTNVTEKAKETVNVWERRVDVHKYATTPRRRSAEKTAKTLLVQDSFKTNSTHSLNISTKKSTLPQHALHSSKKRMCMERLKKLLDKSGQFSAFILELRIQPNNTNLTRRWAVVQNGFLRIYENYGCAAPFLRISLVEAFLKNFSNVEKSRFCFMLEYGTGQSILFQTNTHQELQKWINVINLSIACHTDHFGSGMDLRRQVGTPGNSSQQKSRTCNGVAKEQKLSKSADNVDGPEVTSHGTGSGDLKAEMTSQGTGSIDLKTEVASQGTGSVDVKAEVTSVDGVDRGESCDCGDKVNVSCTPTLVKEVIHRKSYNMNSSSSLDSDDVTSTESFSYRSSLMQKVRHRGYLRVTRGLSSPVLQYCELKGSLFSVYQNEKTENPNQVFNLLYDKYRESSDSSRPLSFTLKNDRDSVVEFGCETGECFEAWKLAIKSVALQETKSCDRSPPMNGSRNSEKFDSPSPARRRDMLRKSVVEEEAMHVDVLRSLNDEMTKGEVKHDGKSYSCYVYEVRNSSGNKTIIRRWCVISDDDITIFERETSREAVTKIRPSDFRLKDIENPRDFPFAFTLEPLEKKEPEDESLVIQASNVKDFRELLCRIKNVHKRLSRNNLGRSSISDSNIQLVKKNSLKGTSPLNHHSKSELSLRKEVKRIFSLARKSSKGELLNDGTPQGHDTWPKVVRRTRKSNRRAMSDTSTEQVCKTHSLVETTRDRLENRKSMGCLYDAEGKFSGYLTEVRLNELYRSEVRKWCVVHNRQFYAYDDKNTKSPTTVIPLKDVKLIDLNHVNSNSFEFRVNNGVVQSYLYRAANDFDKWLTVLAVAINICQTKRAEDARGLGKSHEKGKESKKGNMR